LHALIIGANAAEAATSCATAPAWRAQSRGLKRMSTTKTQTLHSRPPFWHSKTANPRKPHQQANLNRIPHFQEPRISANAGEKAANAETCGGGRGQCSRRFVDAEFTEADKD
jgi:hypothetical protein